MREDNCVFVDSKDWKQDRREIVTLCVGEWTVFRIDGDLSVLNGKEASISSRKSAKTRLQRWLSG